MNVTYIPAELRAVPQWVAWRIEIRHGLKTKVPVNPRTLGLAKTDNPDTWSSFAQASRASSRKGMAGIGFVFSAGDPYCGIDLDMCIGEGGDIHEQALELVERFNTYTEVSPSGRGLKMFLRGAKPPHAGCQKKNVLGCKQIEVYDRLRFFTVTSHQMPGTPLRIVDAGEHLARLCEVLWPRRRPMRFPQPQNVDLMQRERRCMAYVTRFCPEAVSGQGGHNATLRVACEAFRFGLDPEGAGRVLAHFNAIKCHPQWSEKELRHKLTAAQKKIAANGEFGRRLAKVG